jgi:monolysocardiolipin acyltransferase
VVDWFVTRWILVYPKLSDFTGFDKIAPEPRIFKFIPRLGKKVSITIGDPQGMTERTDSILKEWRKSSDWRRRQRNSDEELLIRRRVTETLQEELEILEARVKSSQIP